MQAEENQIWGEKFWENGWMLNLLDVEMKKLTNAEIRAMLINREGVVAILAGGSNHVSRIVGALNRWWWEEISW
jgi:hypothetical protein